MSEDSVQKAGSVKITELKLISNNNTIYDLTDFLIELNVYEDMFANYLYGNMVLSDSLNLIEKVPIIGEEILILHAVTPSLDEKTFSIKKTFRVYKTTDRNIVRDNNTQTFILHFASIELFFDILLPLFVPFKGVVSEVAGKIYEDYIATSRNYQISEANDEIKEIDFETPMIVLNESSNNVKFVSPGWSPFRCLNWLASKAIPKDGVSKNYLFFESNKAFYFGSLEYLFRENKQDDLYIGKYFISVSNIRDGEPFPNLNREFFIAQNVEFVETNDQIKNYTNGYLANRLITLDVYNKKYEITDYDYVKEYDKQFHTSGSGKDSKPIFSTDCLRNPATHISFYPINPKLHTGFNNNVSEKVKEIHGNRLSSILDLTNIKLNMTIPGRTDVEVGKMLYLSYPALGSRDESDKTDVKEDSEYSGYYIITAIHHKINKIDHSMVIECIKDSLFIKSNAKNI